MPYNPDVHHRRSIRLQGYDYTQPGAYFVTICTAQREWIFGEIVNAVMHLNAVGEIAGACWNSIPTHFPQAELDAFVVMPNHVHGILVVTDNLLPPNRTRRAVSLHETRQFGKVIAGSVSTIVGAYKSAATKQVNRLKSTPGSMLWQSRFHDHIIRNENELNILRQYIASNPELWERDSLR